MTVSKKVIKESVGIDDQRYYNVGLIVLTFKINLLIEHCKFGQFGIFESYTKSRFGCPISESVLTSYESVMTFNCTEQAFVAA